MLLGYLFFDVVFKYRCAIGVLVFIFTQQGKQKNRTFVDAQKSITQTKNNYTKQKTSWIYLSRP